MAYQSHLSLETVAFVTALPKRKQKRVLDLADQIAKQPFKIGDYESIDAVGRPVQNLLVEGYHFSLLIDHATRGSSNHRNH